MPGESEVANVQVPQLQVQNADNETVIIQNGGPKKVRTTAIYISVFFLKKYVLYKLFID